MMDGLGNMKSNYSPEDAFSIDLSQASGIFIKFKSRIYFEHSILEDAVLRLQVLISGK
jgi:hypothetical protein